LADVAAVHLGVEVSDQVGLDGGGQGLDLLVF
jgi:hypothetical protein